MLFIKLKNNFNISLGKEVMSLLIFITCPWCKLEGNFLSDSVIMTCEILPFQIPDT